ncbi:MAG: hypothetical protein K2J61_06375 [Clostridia bacterium]|nr:hypothetical protein [Clostridia bacterium]
MKTAKDIALIGIYTALLIGGQFALSGISGVEIVTVLLLGFAYYFGVVRGLLVANAFSLLRCFIFGFFPNVIILYLVYYNLFVLLFGLLGRRFKRAAKLKIFVVLTLTAALMTVFFTALDDVITPLYYGLSLNAAKAYAVASLVAVIPQTICSLVTVSLILPVLLRIFFKVCPLKTSAICEKNARIEKL